MGSPTLSDPPPQVNINQNVQNNTTVIVGQPEPYYYPVYRDDWSTRQHFYLHNRNTKRLRRACTLDEKVIEAIKSKLEEPKSIIWRLRSIP